MSIAELKPGRETWCLFVSDKYVPFAIANSIKAKDESLKLQLKTLMLYRIARLVPENATEEQLCDLVTNCIKASRIGSTRSFKPEFSCRDDLTATMSAPVAVEYERVYVEDSCPSHPAAVIVRRMVIYLLLVVQAMDKKDTPANVIVPA
ncbi:hypothetical protein QYM36_018599 [Artemia franciscana]|uniref:Uncharacterized protein n=1 Tax=Artemia franciscana TaxID=6661 RepID=A0AA88KTR7_ARTSF|nr:hypothetical protein QYM36_018599 [Artemia franciscana]